MTLDPSRLADNIKSALGYGSDPQTDQIIGISTEIVNHVMTAVVNFAPGTVTGTASPSGGPVTDGAASGGIITLVASALEAAFTSVFGSLTPQIKGMADAVSAHVATALCSFAAGNVTGATTNTPIAPGVFAGAGTNGTVAGLSGAPMAALMASSIGGPSPEMIAMCQAIADEIVDNATVILTVASGVAAAGGGPITLGTGTGSIS